MLSPPFFLLPLLYYQFTTITPNIQSNYMHVIHFIVAKSVCFEDSSKDSKKSGAF